MATAILFVVLGLATLVLGAESLVRGAASLALRLGVSALVVGLTIVAAGTSAPEMGVSVLAALRGSGDIAIGNVVGSNIFNIALILGLAAAICPIRCHSAFIRRETPLMIGVCCLVPLLAWLGGGVITRWAGFALLAGGVWYTALVYWLARRENGGVQEQFEAGAAPGEHAEAARKRPIWLDGLYILVGLGLLVGGSRLLVGGATTIAKSLGVSDLVIALTVVAGGTSLPELATSVVAALRKQPDMSVGNIVGSNISNLAFVLGSSAVVAPIGVSREAMFRDIPVMLALSVLCIVLMRSGRSLSRFEGLLLFAAYVLYTAWVVWAAVGGAP